MTPVITGLAGWAIGITFAAFTWAVCFRKPRAKTPDEEG